MKIALVEINNSHDECLYTQLIHLKNQGYKVDGFFHPTIANQVTSFSHLFGEIKIINFENVNFFKRIELIIRLYNNLKQYDKIIINTVRSSVIRDLMLLLLLNSKTECIGTIHNTKKLNTSFTQKIINLKIKKYFVLADHLKTNPVKNIQTESYYPIYFLNQEYVNLKKNKFEKWICIPGRVEFKRRNYLGLIKMLKNSEINSNIKFIILGNINTKDGQIFKAKIKKNKLDDKFILFNQFIDNELYYNYLYSSNYVLLLLHQDSSYLKYKIAGSYNLAYAFKKPLIYREYYKSIRDFKENGISYKDTNFIKIINNLPLTDTKNIYTNKKWHYSFQQKKYINFINS